MEKEKRDYFLEQIPARYRTADVITKIMNSVFPEKYACFINLFDDFEKINNTLSNLRLFAKRQDESINFQNKKEKETLKAEKSTAIDQMINQLLQAKAQVSQDLTIDSDSLVTAFQSLLSELNKEQTNSIQVDQTVINRTSQLDDYQIALSQAMQKLINDYTECQNLSTTFNQNVKLNDTHIDYLREFYSTLCAEREREGVNSVNLPSFESVCEILENYVSCLKTVVTDMLPYAKQTIEMYNKRELTYESFQTDCKPGKIGLYRNAYASLYGDLQRLLTAYDSMDHVTNFSNEMRLRYKILEKIIKKEPISKEELELCLKTIEETSLATSMHPAEGFSLDNLQVALRTMVSDYDNNIAVNKTL